MHHSIDSEVLDFSMMLCDEDRHPRTPKFRCHECRRSLEAVLLRAPTDGPALPAFSESDISEYI